MEIWGHPGKDESFFLPETLHWTVNCECPVSLSVLVSMPDIQLTPRKEPRRVCLPVCELHTCSNLKGSIIGSLLKQPEAAGYVVPQGLVAFYSLGPFWSDR